MVLAGTLGKDSCTIHFREEYTCSFCLGKAASHPIHRLLWTLGSLRNYSVNISSLYFGLTDSIYVDTFSVYLNTSRE